MVIPCDIAGQPHFLILRRGTCDLILCSSHQKRPPLLKKAFHHHKWELLVKRTFWIFLKLSIRPVLMVVMPWCQTQILESRYGGVMPHQTRTKASNKDSKKLLVRTPAVWAVERTRSWHHVTPFLVDSGTHHRDNVTSRTKDGIAPE